MLAYLDLNGYLTLMAQDQLKTILTYVKDVLGVDSFAPATGGALPPQAPVVKTELSSPYLFIGSFGTNEAAIVEMQSRMVSALKLNVKDFNFINLNQTNVQPEILSRAKVVVVFGEDAKSVLGFNELKLGEMKSDASQKIIFTHSLSDLANSAPLKKETWTHLQSVF